MTRRQASMIDRRWLVGGLIFSHAGGSWARSLPATPLAMTVYKNPNCGCCTAWAEHIRVDARFMPQIIQTLDVEAVKRRLRIPAELESCHTATVGGFVVEGHVPPDDIAKLIAARPRGVAGLAVSGMPAGSPGMEMPGGRRDTYDVIAFGPDRFRMVFARHG